MSYYEKIKKRVSERNNPQPQEDEELSTYEKIKKRVEERKGNQTEKEEQTSDDAAAFDVAISMLRQGPSKEASAAFDRYVKPDHTAAILTGRKTATQKQAEVAQKEYEDYVAANPIPRLENPTGYAANPTAGGELDTSSEQYQKAQILRQRAQEASREAENAADQLTYEADMRRINALPEDVRAALRTYTEGRPNVLNPSEYSAGVRIQSRKKLKEAGLSGDEIDALSETYARYLNQLEAQKTAQIAQSHIGDGIGGTLWGNALSVGGNLVSGITGTADVLMEGAGRLLNPNDRYHNLDPNLPGFLPSVYSGTVRQETAQNIEGDASASPLRKGAGKVGSILYQAAMSGVDNLARAAFGGNGALALAGASSFQNAVRETTMKGGSPEQAYAMGVAQGGLEILTEKVSIDNLLETPTPENITQLLKNVVVQGAVEMSEEEMNFAGGLIADAIIMGQNSDYNRDIREMVGNGMPYEQARQQAMKNVLYQALETAAQSFLSGSMTSGTRGAFEYMISKAQSGQIGNSIIQSGGVDALKQLANEVAGVSDSKVKENLARKAGSVTSEMATGTGVGKIAATAKNAQNARRVGELYYAVQSANNLANTEANQTDIAKSLMRKGFNAQTANDIAEAMVANHNGQQLNEAQSKLLKSAMRSKVVQDAVSNIMNNPESTVGQRSKKIRDIYNGVALNGTSESFDDSEVTAQQMIDGDYAAATESDAESHYEVSEDGQTIDSDGHSVAITGISSIENGRMVLETDSGTVDARDVAYASQDEAFVYEAVANLGEIIDADTANKLSKHLLKLGDASSEVYVKAIEQAYTYGYYGYGRDAMIGEDTLSATLNGKQRNVAYGLGEQYRNAKTAADQVKAKNAITQSKTQQIAENATANATADKNAAVAYEKTATGKVHFEGDRNALTHRQKASLTAMEKIADVLGVQIHVFESEVGKSGKHIGANGWYDPRDNSIHIDLHAGANGEGTMLFTLAHELAHHIRKWSPAKFKVLSDFLMEEYGKKGVNVDALVRAQMDKAWRTRKEKLSYDTAFEEVVADSMETMLSDGNVMKRLEKLKAKDKDLWHKIKSFIDELVAKIRSIYRGLKPDSVEGQYVADMGKAVYRLQELFAEALVDASENYQTAEKNTTQEGGVEKYSFRGKNKDGIEVYETSEYVKSLSWKERKKIFLQMMRNQYRGRTAKFVRNGHAYYATFEYRDVSKNIYGDTASDSKGRDAKINVGADGNIFELLEHSEYFLSEAERGKTQRMHRGVKYWDYFIKTVQIDGNVYDVLAHIRKKDSGSFVYDIEMYENKKIEPSSPEDSLESGRNGVPNSSKIIIRNENDVVKNESTETVDAATKEIQQTLPRAEAEISKEQADRDLEAEVKYSDRGYGGIREVLAKKGLDELSKRYGSRFPLSASFDATMRADNTDLVMETVRANSVRGKGSPFVVGRKAFIATYGAKTSVHIKQMGIDADLYADVANESISKAIGRTNVQSTLDVIPHIREILENSILMGVERIAHTDGKGTALYGYRLYNLYWYDDGKAKTPHALVCTVIQDLNKAEGYVFQNIENVTIDRGLPGTTAGMSSSVNDDTYTVAQLYCTVKKIDRIDGGLKYTDQDRDKYLFSYTERNDGAKYSDRDSESVSNRSLLANAFEGVVQNDIEKKKLQEYKAAISNIEALEQKLRELNAQIKELSFAKGPRDRGKIQALRDEAVKTANRIGIYDKQILRLEASKPLQNVLAREKKKAYQRAEQKGKEALDAYRLKAEAKQSEILRDYRETRAALRQQRSDAAVMEEEFIRIVKAYEKLDAKTAAKSDKDAKTITDLRAALKDEAKKHRADQKTWEAEFNRLLREYDASGRSIAKLEEKIERQKANAKAKIESREKTALRHKIQKVVGELNQLLLNESKERHVPDSLKKAVADALALVNMDTVDAEQRAAKYADLIAQEQAKPNPNQDKIDAYTATMENILRQGDKIGQRLKELRDAYEEISQSDDPDIANAYDPVIAGSLKELAGTIGNTSLGNMTIEQLSDVYDMYRMVLTRVRDANKSFLNAKKESISQLASRVVGEVRSVGGEHKYRASLLDPVKGFLWNNLKPVYAFEYLGSSTLTDVFNSVRAGEDTWAKDVADAREYFLDKSRKYGYDGWDFKKKYQFESDSGIAFELTLEQILSLYAYSKRDQAHEHLRLGGFVFDSNIETTKEKGGIIKYKVNTAEAHQISIDTLADIIGALSVEQKGFVDEMQDYLSTTMGAKGNEVTMQMYGVKLFKEKHYFPLKSAKQFMFEQNEVSGEVRIKNSGFTNKTVAKANNPIILNNFMEVWAGHVNDMSMYHSFVLPLEDFNRVFNYNSPKKEGQPPVSVKGTIQNAYSPAAVSYVKNLITDLNGGARTDSTTGFINKMMGMFKKGSVFASLSVVIQQPSAIARAAALVEMKHFIGPRVDPKRHKLLWEEVKHYAPVALIKEMGYFDTNMGKSTQDFILSKEYSGFNEKMKALVTDSGYRDEILSKAPALADELAWCAIWEAVKRETKTNNPGMDVKSEAFLTKAGQRFTEVITKTQVYDSVLSRSANMRSKDTGMKMATAFMAEPTTSINMITDALIQGKRGNRKYCRSAIGSVIASQILNSVLVSFVYAGRDDDEDKTYAEKYVESLTGKMLDSMNPLTYIPFIRDVVSIVQGYDVERSDMSVVSDLWNAYRNLGSSKLSPYRKIENFAGSIAQLFGLPLKNIMRDVRGIYQTIESFVDGQQTTKAGIGYAIKSAVTGKDTSNRDQLYEAVLSGDQTQIDRVKSRYKDESAADSAIRTAIKERFQSGEIDNGTAIDYLVDHGNMDEDDAYWKVEEWEYENETGEDFEKYNEFFTAVQTGKNLKQVIKDYTDNGVESKTLMSQITSHFKPMYIGMTNSERASIKGYLLNAMTVLGKTREDAEEQISGWQFEADHPELADQITYSQYKRWETDGKPYGVSANMFADVSSYRSDGSGTKSQEDVAAYINSLRISTAQKDALWCCFWSKSTLKNAPWH